MQNAPKFFCTPHRVNDKSTMYTLLDFQGLRAELAHLENEKPTYLTRLSDALEARLEHDEDLEHVVAVLDCEYWDR